MKYQLMISEQIKNKVLNLHFANLHILNSLLLSLTSLRRRNNFLLAVCSFHQCKQVIRIKLESLIVQIIIQIRIASVELQLFGLIGV